jgi:serine/threonine-protein kinase
MSLLSALLWSKLVLSRWDLRVAELTAFGLIAAFFAWLQVDAYHGDTLLGAIPTELEPAVCRLVGIGCAMRWFILIVLYGTFIPNTWRRCAAIVGTMAFIPIFLIIGGSIFDHGATAHLLNGLPEMTILMAVGVAIAVFGSYKIRELHEKAHEAQRIGQYRLKEVIGFGGMGTVYLAEHILLRRKCALKVIRADQSGDPNTLLRFEREVQATATLTHWNTVEIYDYGHSDDGTFYYVMEYLPGMNLEDLVERYGPMSPERAIHFLRQVCQALREAHSIGLIHRDIKPSNIFASERGKIYDVVKLLDFGLVKCFGMPAGGVKLTMDGSLAGSPAFMSPEQAEGKTELDARSDIYNLGAVGYYLITGELLFDRASPLQMLHAHAYEAIVPTDRFRGGAPADLQQVLLRCLEKDPNQRFQDANSLERALATCESAGLWTPERADQWWQQNGNGSARRSSNVESARDRETATVKI